MSEFFRLDNHIRIIYGIGGFNRQHQEDLMFVFPSRSKMFWQRSPLSSLGQFGLMLNS